MRGQEPFLYRKNVTKWIYEITSRAFITVFYENTKGSEKKIQNKTLNVPEKTIKTYVALKN